ncbi:MAG TPA: amidophosphoribosyltransferase [Sulfurospirillum sp. UBA11407]|nr:MAG TPA: amidophosphoribosyltransferase [Sulfurospirillum sp. UBA11407]
MRCQLCLNLSWQPLCETCLKTLLAPRLTTRALPCGLEVYSFYKYSEIKNLLHTKHTYQGAKVFSLLAKNALLPFVKNLVSKDVFALPIDDHVRSGYSHSAVLVREISLHVKPLYKSLRAKNTVRYSGQKLHVRKAQKRDFVFTCKEKNIDVILVDDIITTGATLEEAYLTCKEYGVNVLFALTLADAKEY